MADVHVGSPVVYVRDAYEGIPGGPVDAVVLQVFEGGSVRLHAGNIEVAPVEFDESGAPGTFHLPEKE